MWDLMPDDHHRDPWEMLHQELPHVRVGYRWLRPGVMGYTEWPVEGPPHIVVAEGIDERERRVTVAHEAHHVLLGPPLGTPEGAAEDELQVRRQTCRWLLPDARRVGEALRRHGLGRAAEKLGVTVDVLLDWIRAADQNELDVVADWQPTR